MLGGDYLSDIGSVAGSLTERELSNMFFDKAFIGASGVSGQAGVSTFDIRLFPVEGVEGGGWSVGASVSG